MRPSKGLTVDAAHSELNKTTEYRGVTIEDDTQVFYRNIGHQTTNIGEYLGLIEAVKWAISSGYEHTIYCDSKVALTWLKNARTGSHKRNRNVEKSEMFSKVFFDEISKLDIQHWDNKSWGEIPSDFKNKGKSTVTCEVIRY